MLQPIAYRYLLTCVGFLGTGPVIWEIEGQQATGNSWWLVVNPDPDSVTAPDCRL
jgi:hypothetical protein